MTRLSVEEAQSTISNRLENMTSHHFVHLNLHSENNTDTRGAYSKKHISHVSNTNEVYNDNDEESLADVLGL